MYAITITEAGGPEKLVWDEVPDPVPGPDDVLIETVAAGVNRADVLQRQGSYSPPPGSSPYPGLEVSGVLAGTGEQVCALLTGGGYAEKVAVPRTHTLPIPRGLTVEEAAALPEVACTVWSNVVQLAGLRKGETLLVHGGGSGIGTFAIQFGAALGATVITTARPGKHAALRELGAAHTIDYTKTDFVDEVRQISGGADVILDIIGGAYLGRNVRALATGGRLMVIGMQGGRKAELDLGALLAKRGSVTATALRSRPDDEKAAIVAGVREQVWPLVESGAIRPVVDRRLPMREAAQAHRVVESSDHLGKVLLTLD